MAQKKIKKEEDIRMTNADKIRNMNDEELADFLYGDCFHCAYTDDNHNCIVLHDDTKLCEDGVEKWLKKEVE